MAHTEWIVSVDDDEKDFDEWFVGNIRDGERLIRCKDCKYMNEYAYCTLYFAFHHLTGSMDFCSDAERKEE